MSLRPSSRAAACFLAFLCCACSSSDSSDPAPLAVVGVTATTVEGADNDTITVQFNVKVNEAQAEDPANWSLESPIGTAFGLANATIDYVPATRTATMALGAGTIGTAANGNNLQTLDGLQLAYASVPAARPGSSANPFASTVTGDDRPPTALAFADGAGTTASVRFSEPCREILFAELYSGLPGDPGARFVLTDVDGVPATAATGSVTLAGLPTDADTVTIDDATQVVTFEFDSDASVVETLTLRQVVIGIDAPATIADFAAAVNDAGFAFDVTGVANASTCDLTHDVPGSAGNLAITKVGANTTVTGMSGGTDDVPTSVDPLGPGFAWDPTGLGITLDYAPTVPAAGADTVELYGVRDLAGNQAFAVPALSVSATDLGAPDLDAGQSALTVVAAESNDVVTVRFDRPMSAFHILEPSNYAAAPLDLSNASFSFDGSDVVTIELDNPGASNIQFGTGHSLTLVSNAATPLRSAQGTSIPADDVELVVATGDNSPITQGGSSAYVGDAGNPSTCVVVFSEAAQAAGANALANYDIGAVNPAAVQALTPRAFRLTFANPPVATDMLNIQVAGATDLGGTPAAGVISIALTAEDTTAPTATVAATAVSNEGGDSLAVTFDEPVSLAGALSLANYSVTQDAQPLDLSGAELRYDSASTAVEIRLPSSLDLTVGASLAVAVSNVTDLSGNALLAQPAAAPVGGDLVAPGFATAYVNWVADASGQTVDVGFDEDVSASFVEDEAGWSGSSGTPISSVAMRGPRIARVQTVGTLLPGESLELTGLPDLAGNTSGAIAVDPHE